MDSPLENEYDPDSVTPPGETLAAVLSHHGISEEELSRRMGETITAVRSLLDSSRCIDERTAIALEDATSVPATFWINRERRYRESLGRVAQIGPLRVSHG